MTDPGEASTSWYWCFRHGRAEPEGEQCAAVDRLGPYPSRERALHWREQVDQRNEAWREQDRRWEGEDE
ncbi:MAG: hypothetical protein M3P53_04030 [Actinomycetota bacterium]|nr:hypothetical protein [Actinomycetota bacterium]